MTQLMMVTLVLGHVQIFAYSGGPGPAWLDNNAWCFQVQVGKDEIDKFPVCSLCLTQGQSFCNLLAWQIISFAQDPTSSTLAWHRNRKWSHFGVGSVESAMACVLSKYEPLRGMVGIVYIECLMSN